MPQQQQTESEAFVEERRAAIKNKIDLKPNEVPCPECKGSGLDNAHKYPDGSYASCEQCHGYGTIRLSSD